MSHHRRIDAGAPVRVLLAHPSEPVRAGLRQALEQEGFATVAEAADEGSAVDLALRERPDVCLLDTGMAGDAIEATRRINGLLAATEVVMLAHAPDDEELVDALRAGAAGYLLTDSDPARLPHALRGVLDGEGAIPRRLVSSLINEIRHGRRRRVALGSGRYAELTKREWQVLELIGRELTTREISERLGVSPVTVRRHVSQLLRKLGARTREDAVRMTGERHRRR